MEIIGIFLKKNWSDVLVSVVGLSALLIYLLQKRDSRRSAATLLKSQIDSIEKAVMNLKDDRQLSNFSIYSSRQIMNENLWEKYQDKFVKKLSQSEIELIQRFFDSAERLERIRIEIISLIVHAWNDKSTVQHQIIGDLVAEYCFKSKHSDDLNRLIEKFRSKYEPLDLVFNPHFVKRNLEQELSNFSVITGTTVYSKIQKYTYFK